MSDDAVRNKGFAIFKNDLVRRLSPTHYIARASKVEAWRLVELKNSRWTCDCGADSDLCPHLYATQLHRSTAKLLKDDQVDEAHLKCRYCGSLDVARCGYRYNSRGIARRYFCHDCQRKFSIPYVQDGLGGKPVEIVWLVNEVGMLTGRLTELISDLNFKLERFERPASANDRTPNGRDSSGN